MCTSGSRGRPVGLATSMSGVEAANVSDLYRKNYDKEAAMNRMRTMGASADPKLVQRMLANARAVDEGHYKSMLKAYNDANNPSKGGTIHTMLMRAIYGANKRSLMIKNRNKLPI